MSTLKEVMKMGRMLKNNNQSYLVEGAKTSVKRSTGIVMHEISLKHKCEWDENYPENPERVSSILEKMREYGLIDRCTIIEGREATYPELRQKHSSQHIMTLQSTEKVTDLERLEKLASIFDSVYFNEHTFRAALYATGSCIELTRAVLDGIVGNGMAIVRPPGHHAMQSEYNGYCFFNNVALSAQYALSEVNLDRILIVDWDVHHGQGTQSLFYDDPRVLTVSIHRYEHGQFWPNLVESDFMSTGEGAGEGFNVNIPLNETGCGDTDYLAIFHNIILPLAYEGEMRVSPACYAHLITELQLFAAGKVVVCLEGGYFLPSLAEGAALTLRALLGDATPTLQYTKPIKDSVITTIYNVISQLAKKWSIFENFSVDLSESAPRHYVHTSYKGTVVAPPYLTRCQYPVNSEEQIENFKSQLNCMKIAPELLQCKNIVGYAYDSIMELHKTPKNVLKDLEKPERLTCTLNMLNEYKLIERMRFIKGREATTEELRLFHSEEYVEKIKNMEPQTESAMLEKEKWLSVYTNEHTYKSASFAAGALIELVDAIQQGKCNSGIGLVRPPGHHAEPSQAGGYCLFNNVVVAAKHALLKGFQRILIFDWDVHHGNGTQDAFYDCDDVLYISIHRYDKGTFYPNCTSGNYTSIGMESGRGYTVNIPWNHVMMADPEYLHAFTRVVLPIAYEFNPDLIIISAGFDAAVGDPLGSYEVSPEMYGHFVQLLKPLASGRILLALEGGYNVNSVAYCLTMCTKALLGDPLPDALVKKPNVQAVRTVRKVINKLTPYWNNLIKDVVFIES